MDSDNEIPWKRFIGVGDRMRESGPGGGETTDQGVVEDHTHAVVREREDLDREGAVGKTAVPAPHLGQIGLLSREDDLTARGGNIRLEEFRKSFRHRLAQ